MLHDEKEYLRATVLKPELSAEENLELLLEHVVSLMEEHKRELSRADYREGTPISWT